MNSQVSFVTEVGECEPDSVVEPGDIDGKPFFFEVTRSWKLTGTLSFWPPRQVTVTLNFAARCDAILESYEVSVPEIHRELFGHGFMLLSDPDFPESALVSEVSCPPARG